VNIGAPELLIVVVVLGLPVLVMAFVVMAARRRSEARSTVAAPPTPAGWHADPYGRHQLRYWDGGVWTSQVSDAGTSAVDPPPSA
jgi:hypothetical protein